MSKISLILQTVFFIFIYGKAYACIPAPDHEQREKERIERLFEDTNYIVKAVIANMEKFETSVKEYILSQDEISKILTKASKIADSSAQRELEATASLDKGSKDRVEKLLVKRDELKETEKKLLQSSFTFTAHQWLRGKGYNNIKLTGFDFKIGPCGMGNTYDGSEKVFFLEKVNDDHLYKILEIFDLDQFERLSDEYMQNKKKQLISYILGALLITVLAFLRVAKTYRKREV